MASSSERWEDAPAEEGAAEEGALDERGPGDGCGDESTDAARLAEERGRGMPEPAPGAGFLAAAVVVRPTCRESMYVSEAALNS